MQFFKPENYIEARKALEQAGRQDLIGSGRDALIPAEPPRDALQAGRKQAYQDFRGGYVNAIPDASRERREPVADREADHKEEASAKRRGYSPGRKTARRGPRKAR